jgi:hypothetical protein
MRFRGPLALKDRVERTMVATTADLKTKDLVLGECSIAALGFHEVSRAEGPKRQKDLTPISD